MKKIIQMVRGALKEIKHSDIFIGWGTTLTGEDLSEGYI